MADYDFRSLSNYDFEILGRDLLQKEYGVRLENFKTGRDNGIDLRYCNNSDNTVIIQCKHYVESGVTALIRQIKNDELAKVQRLAPARYILVTSVGLTPKNKDDLYQILKPYTKSSMDIIGKEDLNNLLNRYPEIERQNFKLWITSQTVLDKVLHAEIYNYGENEIEEIISKNKYYVHNSSFGKALKILSELNYCIIAGIPGIGKTTLAEMIILYYLQQDYQIIKISNDIEEAWTMRKQDAKQLFYYDDFLGQTSLGEKLNKNEDDRIIRLIQAVGRTKKHKLVFTTREYILNQARNIYEKLNTRDIEVGKCVIDLTHYNKFEKAKILYNHIFFSDLSKEYKYALIDERNYNKIITHANYNPRIIESISKMYKANGIEGKEFVNIFFDTLDNPVELWNHAYENQILKSSQVLLVVLASMPERVLLEHLQIAFWSYYKFLSEKHNFSTNLRDFDQSLKESESTFIKINKRGTRQFIEFQNPSIKDFMNNYIEYHSDIIDEFLLSAVYFEQCKNPKFTAEGVKQDNIIACFKNTLHSDSCRITFFHENSNIVTFIPKDKLFSDRICFALGVILKFEKSFATSALHFILDEFECDILKIDKEGVVDVIKRLGESNVSIERKEELITLAKNYLVKDINETLEIKYIIDFISLCPDKISNAEIERIKKILGTTIQNDIDYYVNEVNDTDEINQFADILREIEDFFEEEMGVYIEELDEKCNEIYSQCDDNDDDDRYEQYREDRALGENVDTQIDEMFNTLVD